MRSIPSTSPPPSRARPRARSWAALATWALLASAAWAGEPPPHGEAAAIRIELRPSVEVARADVTLGDVAVVTARDRATLQRLVELPLGAASRTGAALRVRRAPLLRWIQARTGIAASAIAWAGPASSEIRLASRDVTGDAIAQVAEAALRAALARDGRRVELHVLPVTRSVAAPAGELRLDARPIPRTAVVPRRMHVWVDVWVEERFVRTVPVAFEVGVFGPAYVTTRDQEAGEVLDGSALAVREVEWSGQDAPPLAPGALDGAHLRLRRRVPAGETLTRAQVKSAPLVARGGRALLRAARGRVELETRVEVLEDGRSGETIRVKLPNATAAILARVTGPGTVEVEP
jgi:flagellar basal body P-ring formation protein FlgA